MAETALVTGASSGIGAEFARQLATRGYELVIVARREERLRELAEELPTQAHVIASDLAAEAAGLEGQVEKLGLQVDLLVNNAGFGLRGRFIENSAEREIEMVRVNCEAVVTLTHAFLPGMVERGRGGVITVASTAGMQPLAYEATYSASKAFATTLTEALHAELRGTGVKALAVNPGPVSTEWQQVAGYDEAGAESMPGKVSAEEAVRDALKAFDRGRRVVVPGRFFSAFMRFQGLSPRGVRVHVAERLYRPKS
jgi:short-subunit dehydrogenase